MGVLPLFSGDREVARFILKPMPSRAKDRWFGLSLSERAAWRVVGGALTFGAAALQTEGAREREALTSRPVSGAQQIDQEDRQSRKPYFRAEN